ncbi:serine/threonine protein kinase [Chitinibacter bivalviorum]|uniref:non-specific serine/threonine protein kinase n=1 Tax=Chitinibacter bivalviorum TaxID=2739434 RepID=A0A7H9BM64_9NEIS|nr:serine/threonine-protein kinase [Chitinibacter bivalviorum]QLG89713.1 serine/threonine protein kinase [Chitinibacter bivalviorum]
MSEAKIAHYQLLSRLGQGAMGVVFRARDERLQRDVAIKLLQVSLDQGEAADYAARLLQEARSAARLNHPGIITVYDCGEWRGKPYLAMELVQGVTLKALLDKRGKLAVKDVIGLAKQMFSALAHAHVHDVVHRDIKPANLMLTQNGRLKITDFGIAQLPASDLTRTGTVLGSPRYMSPEQLGGQKIDGRADLYSVGVVLYQALTGQVPFDGEHTMSIIFNILHAEPTDPRQLTPETPAWLAAVILRCLAKSREQRFANAEQALLALHNAAEIQTDPVSPTQTKPDLDSAATQAERDKVAPDARQANSPLMRWLLQTLEMLHWLVLNLWSILLLCAKAIRPVVRTLGEQIRIWMPRLAAATWRGWCWAKPHLLRGGQKLGELGQLLWRQWLKWPRPAQWASGGLTILLMVAGAWSLRPAPMIEPSMEVGREEVVVIPENQVNQAEPVSDFVPVEPQVAKSEHVKAKADPHPREAIDPTVDNAQSAPDNTRTEPVVQTSKSEISDLGNAISRNLKATQKQLQGSVDGLMACIEGDAQCQKSNPPQQPQHRR